MMLVLAAACPAWGVGMAEALTAQPAAAPVELFPGVWKIRVGSPEKYVPSSFRTTPPREESLRRLPASKLPFNLAAVGVTVSPSRTVLEIPCPKSGDELYGFGLDQFSFAQDGQRKRTEISASGNGDVNSKTGIGNSHAAVPLYFSTQGYGVLIDTSRAVEFHLRRLIGKADLPRGGASATESGAGLTLDALYDVKELSAAPVVVADIPGVQGVDLYIFCGPTLSDAVKRYNLFSGGGTTPPLWGLGVKYRTFVDGDQALVEKVRDGLRERNIPCDMLGLEPNWQSQSYPCSLVWRTEKFPAPDAFIRATCEKGFKLNLWFHPYISPRFPHYKQMLPFSGSYLVMRGLVPDLLTPKGSELLMNGLGVLLKQGVSGFKVDECDRGQSATSNPFNFPNAARFPSGVDGEVYGQSLGLILQNQIQDLFRRSNRRTFSDVRASGLFAAPLPFVLYSDTEDLGCYVRQVCNASFAGLLWSPETRNAPNLSQLQRRLTVSTFANQCLWNPWFNKIPLWENYTVGYGNWGPKPLPQEEQQAAIKSLRYFGEFRMSLIPYLYSAYRNYRETGLPPVRALVVDFPADKAVHTIDDQFMFGDSILVAPYLLEHESFRKVYLPAGTDWRDYWTGDLYKGGQTVISKILEVDGVERPALYVRNQSIVPVARPVPFVAGGTVFEVECRVYGDNPAAFTLFEDDGVSYDFEKGAENRVTLSLGNGGEVKTTRAGNYKEQRYRISSLVKPFVSQEYVTRRYEPCDAAAFSGMSELNLSERATYTQSSTLGEPVTGKLFDADNTPGTHAFHTQKERNAHIIIDLKGEEVIQGVSIANRTDQGRFILERAETLAMWSSLDGNSWDAVWQAEEAQPVWNFLFKKPICARYLKIGLQGENFLHLRRVKLYGPRH
jgi:alpha-D-xyloside xylohydrolase